MLLEIWFRFLVIFFLFVVAVRSAEEHHPNNGSNFINCCSLKWLYFFCVFRSWSSFVDDNKLPLTRRQLEAAVFFFFIADTFLCERASNEAKPCDAVLSTKHKWKRRRTKQSGKNIRTHRNEYKIKSRYFVTFCCILILFQNDNDIWWFRWRWERKKYPFKMLTKLKWATMSGTFFHFQVNFYLNWMFSRRSRHRRIVSMPQQITIKRRGTKKSTENFTVLEKKRNEYSLERKRLKEEKKIVCVA